MGFGIRLHVWGDRACFTRQELKVERVSYDVITPSAARGILEAVYWKPAIRWSVDRIRVLNPIRFESIRRNEVGGRILESHARRTMQSGRLDGLEAITDDRRIQRTTTLLRDVSYVIEAHFDPSDNAAGAEAAPGKHLSMFTRRARNGQCFHMPYLGNREFPASFRLIEPDEALPLAHPELEEPRDLGWMLYDIDYSRRMAPQFFRARMDRGVITVPPRDSAEVRS